MVWLVRTLVVCAFALAAPIILAANRYSIFADVVGGLLTGLLAIWLASLVGRKLRATYPWGVKRVGIALYVIGTALAALCIGLAAFAAYSSAGRELIVISASMSIVYWAAGWGLYRSLLHNADTRPAGRKDGEIADGLASRTDWAPLAPVGTRRLRKIALSLGVVGALAAPFAFGTYKARPTYSVWVPLTAQQKENLAARFERSDSCRREIDALDKIVCNRWREQYEQGGDHEYYPDLPKYLVLNGGMAAVTFAGVVMLALLFPMVVRGFAYSFRRYWQWLNA
ncbi:hypothetical protein E4K64_19105 [Bradyrhizobium frederickii]|uniref:Uncharacterized protein n=1 Tax=Bradyrhizobium frederickii TaxID=2560054 RepID=A0A4Y9P3J2_9BRAD|nr:hypothetical protein [Bradyrhizobium frederickii]TFV74102.1 hypothetical protein E4K64_19105 [Bradyrhizobium frederickii]